MKLLLYQKKANLEPFIRSEAVLMIMRKNGCPLPQPQTSSKWHVTHTLAHTLSLSHTDAHTHTQKQTNTHTHTHTKASGACNGMKFNAEGE